MTDARDHIADLIGLDPGAAVAAYAVQDELLPQVNRYRTAWLSARKRAARYDAQNAQIEGLENGVRNYEQWLAEECRKTEALQAQVARIRAFLEGMAGWCSPHGIAADYAQRGLDALDGVDPFEAIRAKRQDREDALDAAIAHTALAAIRDYLETSDDTGTRTREHLLGVLDQAGVPSVVAEELDGADRYADMVDAPLRPETIAALAKRIKAGDLPVRKVKPREQP